MRLGAAVVATTGLLCVVAGCAWLWGGVGLLAVGAVALVGGLFFVDVDGGGRAEPVVNAPPGGRR